MTFQRSGFAVLLFLILSPSVLWGQSVLQFPRVIASDGVFTGIAVGNPTAAEASVTFTAFEADGTMLGGFGGPQNPVTVPIPAGGQYARLFSEIFGSAPFNGWVRATSATSGLTGFFLNGTSALTDLDGAGSTTPLTELILPFAAEDSVARTEVTVVNVNPEPADVLITLYSREGSILSTSNIALPANALRRQTLAVLLAGADLSSASHLVLRATRPIVAHELVADFELPGASLRRETAALSGAPITSGTSHVLPQFATGGGWLSLIGVVNGIAVSQQVTLTAYREDGSLWDAPSNPRTVTLPANGAVRATVDELFGFGSADTSTGWIGIASQGSVHSYIAYGNTATPSFALVGGSPAGEGTRFSVFSQVAEGAGYYTGLTVVNAGTEPADIEFYTLLADGTTVGRSPLTLAPGQKAARLFRELLPASLQQIGGWGYVRSTKPVIAAVLFGTTNGFALANVPQQVPAADFVPPPQTTGAITGTVRSGGTGVSGVLVTLSGPVNTSATTDASGDYVFTRLLAGQYKVTATRTGAVVVPSERTVTVDRNNVADVDFEAGGVTPADAPSIRFISPVSTFAGNSSLSVRILGSDFTPSSVVRLNEQILASTFVNDGELRAVIPASMLAQAGTLRLLVETAPPGGGRSPELDFTVNPVSSNPLIEGNAQVGSFPTGVAIDTVRNRALITNQSSDSVTVLNLADRTVVAEIPVGRSPAEGIAIHPGRSIALVANVGSNNVSVINLETNTVSRTVGVGGFPVGVAVNTATNRAYVANGEDDTVSVIDLDTFAATGTIRVGDRPSNIAVNEVTNQAVVTNVGSGSVTVVDLNANTVIATIPTGEFPRGVAINPDTNLAVVANAGSNSIAIINLETRAVVAAVEVGAGPTGVAIHRGTNSVLVTNSGVTRTNPNVGGASSVAIVNLDTLEILENITVGSAAFGVAADQERQIAVAANYGSNNVTVIRIPNPVPRIAGVEPKTFPAGGGSFNITVRGSGFVATSVLTLNGNPLPTVFVSSTELRGFVSAALVDQLLQVQSAVIDGGKATVFRGFQTVEFNIAVQNPGPGGGSSPPPSDPAATQIQPENPVPVLLSLSPTEIQANTADLTLTLNGSNFNATTIINFGGLQFSPSTSSHTTLTTVVPQAQLVAGNVPVSVMNPAPGGGTAGPLTFKVNAATNPSPSILSVNPTSVPAGSGATVIAVQGAGFIASTTGSLAGVAGVVAGNTMTFALNASNTASAGTLNGLVSNPAPGGGTATFSVNVLNPVPTVSGFTPTDAGIGATPISIQVTGTNFQSNSQITLGGTPIDTSFVSSTQLTGTIPVAFLTAAGSFPVGVTNPGPGGGTATGGAFTVRSGPALTSIAPQTGAPGTSVDVALTGVNFVSGATVAVSGSGIDVGSVIVVNSTTIAATFAIDPGASAGPRNVTVTTPGGTSNAVAFTINVPAPTLSAINPASATPGGSVDVTLTGANFAAGATVSVSGTGIDVGSVVVVNSTAITANFAVGDAAASGPRDVTVTTPGGTSNPVVFTINAAAPTLSAVDPASGNPGSSFGVILTGTNFVGGASVTLSGSGVGVGQVNVLSSTMISTTFSIEPNAAPGPRDVAVTTPGGTTSPVVFTVAAVAPTLSSINPSSGALATTVAVTLTGSNFTAGATVSVSGTGVFLGTVNVVNSTTITTTFGIDGETTIGPRNVTVTTPGGTSAPVTFTLTSGSPFSGSVFTGAVSTNWSDPANWLPAGVPDSSTDVLIPANAVRQPVLTDTAFASNLTVEDGATLNVGNLEVLVSGSVDAGNTITGTGYVVMVGEGSVKGTLPNLEIDEGVVAFVAGSTPVINGNLVVSSGGELDISSATVTVTGSLSTSTSGLLKMQDAAGNLTVNGSATFNGANTSGQLTAGTLSVGGDFTVSSSSATNFAASGTHFTVLNGTAPQTVDMTFASPTQQRFQNLTLDNPAGVVFSDAAAANGNVLILSGNATGSGPVTIAGSLSDTETGRWQVASTTLNGSPTDLPSSLTTNLTITGSVILPNDVALTGNVTVSGSGASLEVRCNVFEISGNLSTTSGGILRMPNFSCELQRVGVGGAANFNGGSTSGLLIAGSLEVKGSFVVGGSSATSFAASGQHVTVLNGAVSQAVSMIFPSATQQRFHHLSISNTAGVVFGTNAQATGNLNVLDAAPLSGAGTLTVGGNLTTVSGSSITTAGFTLGGTMAVSGTFSPATATFDGSGQTIQAGLSYQNVRVTGTAAFSSLSPTLISGNLTATTSGVADVAGASVTVTGSLSTDTGGALQMQNSAGVLTVQGNASFNGGSTTGLLTAGTLNVQGTFTTGGSSATNFSASGAHLTVLNGTTPQNVSLTFPSATQQRFQNLELNNEAGVIFSGEAQVNGDVMAELGDASGAGPVTIVGSLGVESDFATWQVNNTIFSGSPVFLPSSVTSNITFTGAAVLPSSMVVQGSVTVSGSGASLEVQCDILDIYGGFSTASGGVLRMLDVACSSNQQLIVRGAASFGGGSTAGLLTDGVLELRGGSFTATGSSATNFAASGAHLTRMIGTGSQSVSMTFAGPTQQRFQDLELNNGNDTIFNSEAQISGTLTILSGTAEGPGPVTLAGNLIDSEGGNWQVVSTTFSGSPTMLPASISTNASFTGVAVLPNNLAISGNLTVTGSGTSLEVRCNTLNVTGNLTTASGGVLKMPNFGCGPEQELVVGANATFDGGSSAGELAAGTLRIRGNFSATGSSSLNFAAAGSHLTVFDGTSPQTVSMTFAGPTQQRFQNLTVSSTTGVAFNSNVQANGDLTLGASASVSGGGSLTAGGNLMTAVGSSVSITGLTLGGSMNVLGVFSPGTTTFAGSSQTIQAGLSYQNVTVTGTAAFSSVLPTSLTGNLTASSGGIVDVAGATVTVSGTLGTTASGALQMQDAAGVLTVAGSASFNGGASGGFLTAGTLNVGGSFTVGGSSALAFAASGTHRTVLNGTASQSVSMTFPSPTQQRFQNLDLNNSAGVVFTNAIQVNGTVDLISGSASGPGPVTIGGNLDPGSGGWGVGSTIFSGSPTVLPPLISSNVTFTGAAVLPNDVEVLGDVTVSGSGASLEIRCDTLDISGNFTTASSGILRMPGFGCEGDQRLEIDGDATFGGGSTEGLLTNGAIEIEGDFTATGSSATNFAPTGSHTVLLTGPASQTVTMTFTSLTQQRFATLDLSNATGMIMGSDLVVTESLLVDLSQGMIDGGGMTLTVQGVSVDALILDRVLLVINLVPFESIQFQNVIFQNYLDADTRITLSSSGGNFDLGLNGPINFADGVPDVGKLVNATDTAPGDSDIFTVTLYTSPYIDADQGTPATIANGGAQVEWSD